MCGHVGVAGDITRKGMKAFRTLLLWDSVRGEDGTGVALVPFVRNRRTVENTEIIKMPIASPAFLETSYASSALGLVTHGVVIGHNRAATVGQHTYGNTHPFLCKNVVGAHNGTVDSHHRKDLPGIKGTWGTDSETIMRSFSGANAKDAVQSMTACARGAWAFVWYDYRDDSINFLRNEHRPLYYAFDSTRDQLFWASEAGMLRGALEHAGVEVETRKNSSTWIIRQLPVDTHLSWNVPSTGERFAEVERTKLHGKKPATTVTRWTGGSKSSTRSTGDSGTRGGTSRPFTSTAPAASLEPATFDLLLFKYEMSDDDVFRAFAKGDSSCMWCDDVVSKQDIQSGEAVALSHNTVVCGGCKTKTEVAYTVKKVANS